MGTTPYASRAAGPAALPMGDSAPCDGDVDTPRLVRDDPSVPTAQAVVFLVAFLLYAHLTPALRSLGTPLLASAGILTVVLGLAA